MSMQTNLGLHAHIHTTRTHAYWNIRTYIGDVSEIFTMTNEVHFQGLPHSLPNEMLLLFIR
jgi:hypothetical protein